MKWVSLLLGLMLHPASAAGPFVMPDGFEGIWQGTPSFNVLGPWNDNITFSIAKAANGDYLMEDILEYDTATPGGWGWQRFYIQGSGQKAGLLWYCSNTTLWGMIEYAGLRPGSDSYSLESVTANSVTWCLSNLWNFQFTSVPFPMKAQGNGNCAGCDCANFTISLDSHHRLTVDYRKAGAPGHTHSKHLVVQLDRISPPHPIQHKMPPHFPDFKCDASLPRPNLTQSRCPFRKPRPLPAPKPRVASVATGSEYQHCYILNRLNNYKLEWTLDRALQQLRVQMSATTTAQGYVAIGFRPLARVDIPNVQTPWPSFIGNNLTTQVGVGTKFGMVGADIVLGSAAGVKTMYAALYTGAPSIENYLHINHAKAAYDSGAGQMVVSFTRPLVGGFLQAQFPEVMAALSKSGLNGTIDSEVSDNIWAVGQASSGFPMYHDQNRGLTDFSWSEPSKNSDYNTC